MVPLLSGLRSFGADLWVNDAETGTRREIIFAAPFTSRSFSDPVNGANVKVVILFLTVDFEAERTRILLGQKKQQN